MPSIDTRIAAIAAALERRRMEQECPEDDLSRSLREFGEELAQLDDLEKAEPYLKKAYGTVSEKMLESEIACEYYKKVLEPEIRELYLASSGESVDGDTAYGQWLAERFGDES